MENNQLQKWALAAEIVGGLAVVVSLIIVAYQINQSTEQQEVAAYQDLINSFSNLAAMVVEDDELSSILNAAESEPSGLTPDEIDKLIMYAGMVYRHGDMAYLQYETGAISKDRLDSMLTVVIVRITSDRVSKDWWDTLKVRLYPPYVEYVEELVLIPPYSVQN